MDMIIGYCRVSTENQKEEGTIELQRQALKEHAESKGYELVNTFEDEGISGGIECRPGLAALFDYLEANKGIKAVLIYKLDRLARDLYIQEHLIKKLESLNVGLISTKEPDLAGNDPMRKAFRQFMGIVSELEKAFITMRLGGGRINKAKRGGYAGGGVALGYKAKQSDLVIDPDKAEAVRQIFKMRRHKRMSLWQIAKELNSRAVPTAKGGKWYAGTVKYILNNPIYRGKLNYSDVQSKRADLALI